MIEAISHEQAKASGLSHFFDGVACRNGHVAKKRTSNHECMECARMRASEYYASNREAVSRGRVERYANDVNYAASAKARSAQRRAGLGDAARACDAAYYAANRELVKARSRQWALDNRDRKNAANLAWNKANPENARKQQRAYEARRRVRDPVYAMGERISSSIRQSLINGGYTKRNRVSEILGCSYVDFAAHLERQFVRGMSWSNRHEWHIDHIIPISSAKAEGDIIRLNHFTNLRPLWAVDNAAKGCRRELLL